MAKLDKYTGVIPAFYACYDGEGKINRSAVRQLVDYYIDRGVNGLYVNGSSGECIYLTVEERKRIIETVVDQADGRLTIIDHVACNNTADSMELARHAESLGVDAIASIPPIYFHLPEEAIADYWNDISSAAPHTDFIIYNIPQLAGVALSRDLYLKMLENLRVIGVKNSSMAPYDIQIFKTCGKGDHVVFNGPDEQFIAGRVIGADAGIGGTYGAMPELFIAMNDCLRTGNLSLAVEIQNVVNGIIEELCAGRGNMYAMIKEVLRIKEGIDLGSVRRPLAPLTGEDRELAKKTAARIEEAVARYGL